MRRTISRALAALLLALAPISASSEDWPDGWLTLGGYALGELPAGAWGRTARAAAGGGIRAEFALSPGKAGLALCAEGAKVFPADGSGLEGGIDFSLLGGVWARLLKRGRLSVVPSIWVGPLVHRAAGENGGIFADLAVRAEAALRVRTVAGLSVDVAPFYVRAAEKDGNVLHGPGLRAGIVYNFGRWTYRTIYPDEEDSSSDGGGS